MKSTGAGDSVDEIKRENEGLGRIRSFPAEYLPGELCDSYASEHQP